MVTLPQLSRRQWATAAVIAFADFCSAVCVSLQAPFYPAEVIHSYSFLFTLIRLSHFHLTVDRAIVILCLFFFIYPYSMPLSMSMSPTFVIWFDRSYTVFCYENTVCDVD